MIEQPTTEQLIEHLAHSAGGETGVNLSTLAERQAADRLREKQAAINLLRSEVEALRAVAESLRKENAGLRDAVDGLGSVLNAQFADICTLADRLRAALKPKP